MTKFLQEFLLLLIHLPLAAAAAAGTATRPKPWTTCLLPSPPLGACGNESWGAARESSCDPDLFMNKSAFSFAPPYPPPEFPLSAPLPLRWHVFLREDGSGDVSDDELNARIARANTAFAPGGWSLAAGEMYVHPPYNSSHTHTHTTSVILHLITQASTSRSPGSIATTGQTLQTARSE